MPKNFIRKQVFILNFSSVLLGFKNLFVLEPDIHVHTRILRLDFSLEINYWSIFFGKRWSVIDDSFSANTGFRKRRSSFFSSNLCPETDFLRFHPQNCRSRLIFTSIVANYTCSQPSRKFSLMHFRTRVPKPFFFFFSYNIIIFSCVR